MIAENITEYIRRHITQENSTQRFQQGKVFVSVRMGVISKISEESTRRKISIGLGVKTTIRVLSAHLGLNCVLSAHLGLNRVLSALLG